MRRCYNSVDPEPPARAKERTRAYRAVALSLEQSSIGSGSEGMDDLWTPLRAGSTNIAHLVTPKLKDYRWKQQHRVVAYQLA